MVNAKLVSYCICLHLLIYLIIFLHSYITLPSYTELQFSAAILIKLSVKLHHFYIYYINAMDSYIQRDKVAS